VDEIVYYSEVENFEMFQGPTKFAHHLFSPLKFVKSLFFKIPVFCNIQEIIGEVRLELGEIVLMRDSPNYYVFKKCTVKCRFL